MPLISSRISLIKRCSLLVERPNRSYFRDNDDDLLKASPSDDIAKKERKRDYAKKLRKQGKTAQDVFEEMGGKAVLEFAQKYLG